MPAGILGHNRCQLSSKVVLLEGPPGLPECTGKRHAFLPNEFHVFLFFDVLVPSMEQPLQQCSGRQSHRHRILLNRTNQV